MSRKLRVKLITIPWELEVPTLTLASIAAVTPEEHFEVCIVDLLRERLVLDEPVDLVGITASVPRIKAAYALADIYRSRGVKVVIGGHHVTALPDEGLEHADAVVCGEGETSWSRICDQMLTNPSQVQGIYHDPPPDLTTLPLPRIDLMKLDRYQSFYFPVIASRGCSSACAFCFSKRMTRGYRTYPIRHVIEQIRRRPPRFNAMYFVDDNLAGDMDYTRELFSELRRHDDLPFGMQARYEYGLDPENVRLAGEAGCGMISTGFESVCQDNLDRTGKGARVETYKEVINNIQGAGIMATANWMFGLDWDPPDIFEQTWEFLRDSGIYHSTFTVEVPFPGTPAHARYLRQGRILSHNYDDYVGKDRAVHRPAGMSVSQLEKGIRWLIRRYYSIGHRARVSRHGYRHLALFSKFNPVVRFGLLTLLNCYEYYLWHYRAAPSLRWLNERLLPLNKHRYVGDLLKGTNFWSQALPSPRSEAPVLATASPFAEQSGSMAPGEDRLQPA